LLPFHQLFQGISSLKFPYKLLHLILEKHQQPFLPLVQDFQQIQSYIKEINVSAINEGFTLSNSFAKLSKQDIKGLEELKQED